MSRLERVEELQQRRGRPIRVALVGAGQMGRGFAAQIGRIPGLELSVAVDIDVSLAHGALKLAGRTEIEEDLGAAVDAVHNGVALAISDASALPDLAVDVVVEATGVPEVGAVVAHRSILARQHAVLLNVETDVTVGRYLDALARSSGVVYSVADGDEPVCAKELYDLAQELAFEVVCLGKGKNNPFLPDATPASCAEEASGKHMNPKMLASFQDGSKTMIEMAALANATGLVPDVTGMHGPTASVAELSKVLVPNEFGGVLSGSGRVDYAFGPAPGVFAVVTTDDASVAEEMTYLKMGDGPFWALYRPFHLASLEAPRTVITAMLEGEPALRPATWAAEVVATAKRRLEPGDVIGGIGDRDMRGVTYAAPDAVDLLPLGLAQGSTVVEAVEAGEPIPLSAVTPPDSPIWHLRALQEELFPLGA